MTSIANCRLPIADLSGQPETLGAFEQVYRSIQLAIGNLQSAIRGARVTLPRFLVS